MTRIHLSFLTLALLTSTGCGTIFNLTDPPNDRLFMGTGSCYPFGGVTRSALLAGMGTPMGIAQVAMSPVEICKGNFTEGFEMFGQGLWLGGCGLLAIPDVPLSLAGDVLTWPIVNARINNEPWATWWGKKGRTIATPTNKTPGESEGATQVPATTGK